MSETKRIPTWSDVHEVEDAIKALGNGSAAAARIGSLIPGHDGVSQDALDSVINVNETATRLLRDLAATMRTEREADDIVRKKEGRL